MSKYPYIGKSRKTPNIVLFTSRLTGFCLRSGEYSRSWNEIVFDAVTSEFLSGKKIEVNSPFESKLIQLAAFKAGGETRAGGEEPVNSNAPFILIDKDLKVTFEDDRSFFDAYKMDGIKLPRFDNPTEFAFPELEYPVKHFDCVCAKCGGRCCIGNCDEWPKVGSEVTWGEREIVGTVKCIDSGWAWILCPDGNHTQQGVKYLKPKTPEQELREELSEEFCAAGYDNEKFIDILMSKYNITKKVKDND